MCNCLFEDESNPRIDEKSVEKFSFFHCEPLWCTLGWNREHLLAWQNYTDKKYALSDFLSVYVTMETSNYWGNMLILIFHRLDLIKRGYFHYHISRKEYPWLSIWSVTDSECTKWVILQTQHMRLSPPKKRRCVLHSLKI